MHYQVTLTLDAIKQIRSEGRGAHRTIKYRVELAGAKPAVQEGLLAVSQVYEVPSGPAGTVTEIHGTLSDASGVRQVILKHYPVYGGSKGTVIMREA